MFIDDTPFIVVINYWPCLVSVPLFFDTPHSSRNRNKDKNGNKVLNIEVKYSLSKGTVLPRNFKFLAHSELMSKKETLSFNLT